MHLSAGDVAAVFLATMLGATVQGSIGFGMNLVTVPVLAIVEPAALPATAVLLGFPMSVTMVLHEHEAVDRRATGWVLVGRVPGTVAGTVIVALVATSTLSVIVGVVVLVAVAMSVRGTQIDVNARTCTLTGVGSGVMGTSAGIGGPPLALLFQHREGRVVRSTLAACFFFGTSFSLLALSIAGEVELGHLALAAALVPAVLLGFLTSRMFRPVLDRGWLRPAVLVFAALSGTVAIVNGLR